MPLPWTDYPSGIRQFSGLVQAAAEARFGAAATNELIAQAARDAKITLSFSDYTGLARLYGSFVEVRGRRGAIADAAATFGRTGLDQGITAAMISRPPWAPSDTTWSQNPYVLVKGRYLQDTPEGPVTGYFSHRYRLSEVNTVGQVATDMQAQMEQGAGGTDLTGAALQEIVSIEAAQP